jgi:hypothetical protein
VWLARNTPEHKPTNIEHNDDKIVGHIVGNWPVNDSYELIDDSLSVEQLPDTFHIVTASVIYRNRHNAETKKEVEELIGKIEAGQKFVSMECVFRGFDYAVQTPEGKNHVLSRTVDTAFLTKHLKAYGGTGEYDGHRVARLLRRIVFCGKGYVDKPANPNSIIFDKNHMLQFNHASEMNPFDGSNITISNKKDKLEENDCMADNSYLENQVKELKAMLDEIKAENATLKEQVSKAGIKEFEVQIEKLQSDLETTQSDLAKSQEDLAAKANELEEALQLLIGANDAKQNLEKELAEVRANELTAKRVATLVDGGMDKEEAEAKVQLFVDLSDEQFEVVATTLIQATEMKKDEEKKKKDEKAECSEQDEDKEEETEDESSDAEVLDSAEAEDDPDLSTAAESDESKEQDKLETVRAGLHNWVVTKVLQKEVEESK